jgi:hypothetical protein
LVAAGLLAAFEQTVRPVVKSTGSFALRLKAGRRHGRREKPAPVIS